MTKTTDTIEEDYIPVELKQNQNYKLTWAHKAANFKFDGFDASGMVLMLTKTGKQIRTSRSAIRHTKANAQRIAKKRLDGSGSK